MIESYTSYVFEGGSDLGGCVGETATKRERRLELEALQG